MSKPLPKELTSYDLLKAVAVIIMIVDHAGYFFFQDNLWWRAIGRIGFPVWFFLIGHASGRRIAPKLWGGALFLIALYSIAGSHFLPLNALVTIIFIRLVLDHIMKFALTGREAIIMTTVILVVLIVPTNYLMEYGAQAVIVAMFGYLVRHRQERGLPDKFVQNFTIAAFFSFVIPQYIMHGLSAPQFFLMAAGTGLVFWVLMNFRAGAYPALTEKTPRAAAVLIRFCGRRTLEIYVAHIAVFQAAALIMGQERFGLFDWKFMPQF